MTAVVSRSEVTHEHDRTGRPTCPLRRFLRLEYQTVGWNTVEGVVAVAAALAVGWDTDPKEGCS